MGHDNTLGRHVCRTKLLCQKFPRAKLRRQIFRVGFWQNGFFADFYFWAAGFFRGFCRRIFSPHFCGKKCPEKSSRKIPGKILQNLYSKNPRHISAEGPGQKFFSAGEKPGGKLGEILGEILRVFSCCAHCAELRKKLLPKLPAIYHSKNTIRWGGGLSREGVWGQTKTFLYCLLRMPRETCQDIQDPWESVRCIKNKPSMGKACFGNRALIKEIFEAPKCL